MYYLPVRKNEKFCGINRAIKADFLKINNRYINLLYYWSQDMRRLQRQYKRKTSAEKWDVKYPTFRFTLQDSSRLQPSTSSFYCLIDEKYTQHALQQLVIPSKIIILSSNTLYERYGSQKALTSSPSFRYQQGCSKSLGSSLYSPLSIT